MNAKQILEKFNMVEQEVVMDLNKIKQILDANLIDYEIEEDEQLHELTYKTTYDEYKYYHVDYDDHSIMLAGDFKSLCKDISNMLINCLPDGFEQFFNTDALYNNMIKDNYYLYQAIVTINKMEDEDLYNFEDVEYVTVDNVDYVIFKEV